MKHCMAPVPQVKVPSPFVMSWRTRNWIGPHAPVAALGTTSTTCGEASGFVVTGLPKFDRSVSQLEAVSGLRHIDTCSAGYLPSSLSLVWLPAGPRRTVLSGPALPLTEMTCRSDRGCSVSP